MGSWPVQAMFSTVLMRTEGIAGSRYLFFNPFV